MDKPTYEKFKRYCVSKNYGNKYSRTEDYLNAFRNYVK